MGWWSWWSQADIETLDVSDGLGEHLDALGAHPRFAYHGEAPRRADRARFTLASSDASRVIQARVIADTGDTLVVQDSHGNTGVLEWFGGHSFMRGDLVTLVGDGYRYTVVNDFGDTGTYYEK
jgi:hypothetical protein